MRDTAKLVRTKMCVTPRSFLADGGQRFFLRFAPKKDRNLRRDFGEIKVGTGVLDGPQNLQNTPVFSK